MSSWVNDIVGDSNMQYSNALRLGQDNNRFTGNAILPKNFSGNFRGGRGGSIAGILGTAAVPVSLLAMQNQYKDKRNFFSRRKNRRSRSRSRKYRRSRRR